MEEKLASRVKSSVARILPYIVDIRRSIHREPEIGLETFQTRRKVADALRNTPLDVWSPLLGADFIAELKGAGSRTICLRADMDGLPIEERTGVPYSSTVSGAMHACGHDGHTAILVGTALVLQEFRERLPATVRFVFQPGEEVLCAGKTLVERGCCEGVDAAFALHGWPGLAVGCMSARPGAMFAAGATFSIHLTGKGCHGAMPERGCNPIPAAASIVDRLCRLHESLHQEQQSVVSVCSLNAGRHSTIIPDSAVVRGTARYLSVESGEKIEDALRKEVAEAVTASGVRADIEYETAYSIPVTNSLRGFEHVRRIASSPSYPGSWCESTAASMVCEDFAFYLNGREGALFLLGLGESCADLHNAGFDFNDSAIASGILAFSLLALEYCS